MSKERDLLQEALNWMLDLSDIYTDEGPEDDRLLLRLVDDINKIKELLAQPETEQDKVDFETLNEMGLKRLQVSNNLVLQESCAKSPTLIFAESGEVIEIIKYKKLLEIKSFINEILNYTDTPQIGVDDER